jgi:hypothetical protein
VKIYGSILMVTRSRWSSGNTVKSRAVRVKTKLSVLGPGGEERRRGREQYRRQKGEREREGERSWTGSKTSL